MLNKVISIATWLMLLILAGCSDASPYAEESSAQERTITLNLDITTKADADPSESPDNFHLWIFNGAKLLKYIINSNPTWEKFDNGSIDLKATVEAEIDATEVNAIQFYLLLNTNVTGPWGMTPANLKNLTFTLPDQPYSHDNKVPMSGEATLDIFPSQIHYDVRIDAVRSVAKLGIYCTKGNTSPSSTLTINQVTLSKVPDKGYLFKPDDYSLISYSESGKNLLSESKQISSYYTEDMPPYSNNSWDEEAEGSFEEISSPYLLENPNGEVTDDGFLQVDGTVSDNRYCITLDYTLNGESDTKKIYVSQIERNQYSKIYIRINDATTINTCCQINSWTEHEMDVPAFE
ncbi:hypothetical protein [Mediterranea massiliensis]|uniref:hypothetical protein n=1 Tax=Mediterranea massiliensis TaxID=1841865 RepID=UPI00266D2B65|nr:hypothetical protein [Mediterranea massiliensis]